MDEKECPQKNPDTSLSRLLADYGINRWDLILIGDGSGSGAMAPCGWAVTIIDRLTGVRRMLAGAQNMGSITVGELMPYVMAMDHFDTVMKTTQHRKDLALPFAMDVHIFTDSSCTALAGTGQYARTKHGGLWTVIAFFRARGYNFTWHWFKRDNPFQLHKLMDEMASELRERVLNIEQTTELYDLLP